MKYAWLLLCLALVMSCTAVHASEKGGAVKAKLEAFDLRQVRLLDGPCKAAQETDSQYLRELDSDRLLYSFRQTAGLPTPAKPMGGWEAPSVEIRGHFVGHYLSACAQMYASTGDEALKLKADAMVAELAKCQTALGGEYLSAFPASFFDRLESMNQVPWCSYYAVHKLMAGLYDMYAFCGNKQALEVLKGMASYFGKRMDKLPGTQIDRILTVEYGGMSEVLHNLYSVTHDPAHLKLAHRFDFAEFLGPLVLEHDNLTGLHGNAHIAIVLGSARHYESTGDERYRTAARYFWDRVVGTRSYASGGTTVAERWPEPNQLAGTLSANNHECCKTHNMLKLTRYLFRWTADPKYADYYERAFTNGIMGTQEPGTGMLMYYVPMATGYQKLFGSPNDSFWCCYGTGVESFAKLGDSIYFHDQDTIYVNLFVPSTVNWVDKGVLLEQKTRFPDEESTSLTVHTKCGASFSVKVRIPYWATTGVRISVNGKAQRVTAKPGSYATIKRTWGNGDRIDVKLPMSLYVQRMPDDADVMAVMYGPMVLAGIVKADAERLTSTGLDMGGGQRLSAPREPIYFVGNPEDLSSWIKPVRGKPVTFRTVGQPRDFTLVPLNRVVYEAYGVYWLVTKEGSARHKELLAKERARKDWEARVVDRVLNGDAASEQAHSLQGENTSSGPYLDRVYRHALNGGWWSWDLSLGNGAATKLSVIYLGDDHGGRTFDVSINDRVIATEVLEYRKPGQFFETIYDIPADMLRLEKITVKFDAKDGQMAGGVFDCATVKP